MQETKRTYLKETKESILSNSQAEIRYSDAIVMAVVIAILTTLLIIYILTKYSSFNDAWIDICVLLSGNLASITAIIITHSHLQLAQKLTDEGITVLGMVFDKWERCVGEEDTSYYVSYRYEYLGIVWIGKKSQLNIKQYNELHINQSVAIRFLPSDPAFARLEGEFNSEVQSL